MSAQVLVQPLEESHLPGLFEIFREINVAGEVFPYPADTTFAQFKTIWMPESSFSYVAHSDGELVGGYYVKPQWPGRGAHVGTATYMVSARARGKGAGLTLGEHSLKAAREKGYSAMQFNLVISTNKAAVALWQKIGFKIIGTVPGAFNHALLGPVDTYLMHRFL